MLPGRNPPKCHLHRGGHGVHYGSEGCPGDLAALTVRDEGVDAANIVAAVVICTGILVITIRGTAVDAKPCLTMIVNRTGVAVIAEVVIQRAVQAAGGRVTAVASADIQIVTADRKAGAYTVRAEVGIGAEIGVVAGAAHRKKGAKPSLCIAEISSAEVVIIADKRDPGKALTFVAPVSESTSVLIVAGRIKGGDNATLALVAPGGCTGIGIVTDQRMSQAEPVDAKIAVGAGIAIVTWSHVWGIIAAAF